MKHGRGKYTKRASEREDSKDEEPIFAPFENDKLNGLGVQGKRTILFKEGMEVNLEGDGCSCKKCYIGFCSMIACGVFYACFVGHLISGMVFPPLVFLQVIILIIYNILSCQSDASQYLSNTLSVKDIFDNISKAIAAAPETNLKI